MDFVCRDYAYCALGGVKLTTEFDIHALKGHLAQGDDLVGKEVAVPTLPSLVQSPEPM